MINLLICFIARKNNYSYRLRIITNYKIHIVAKNMTGANIQFSFCAQTNQIFKTVFPGRHKYLFVYFMPLVDTSLSNLHIYLVRTLHCYYFNTCLSSNIIILCIYYIIRYYSVSNQNDRVFHSLQRRNICILF